jgi:hypothetical protein
MSANHDEQQGSPMYKNLKDQGARFRAANFSSSQSPLRSLQGAA